MVCQTYHPPNHADYHQKRRIIPFTSNSLVQARQAGGFYAGQARPGFYAGQLGPHSHWQKKLQVLPPHDNLDILGRTGFYFFLVCRAGWAMPGRFAETLDSGPQDNWKNFAEVVGLDDNLFFCWEESRPWRGLRCRAGAAGWRSAKPYDRMIRMIRMTRRAGVSGKNMFIRHVLRHVEIKRV